MNQKAIYALWAVLFILCAAFGFIPEPEGLTAAALTLVSVAFFVPPAMLLFRAEKQDVLLIRNLSALSLTLTLALLIGNFLTAFSSETLGAVFHYVLIVVSSPMICSGHWALSLFLWACLLVASLRQLRR